LQDGTGSDEETSKISRPIADLFLECTVMFADIAGFTAWSSVRDPAQVFTLLESLYGAIDSLAGRRGVFKVETIGDSYVAVTGESVIILKELCVSFCKMPLFLSLCKPSKIIRFAGASRRSRGDHGSFC
jgi:hypothetical protein